MMINLFDPLHLCHPLDKRQATALAAIAKVFSWSSKTKASFQPNSNTDGLRYFPARLPIALHASSLQVRLTQATCG
jgi:hypothetical protein